MDDERNMTGSMKEVIHEWDQNDKPRGLLPLSFCMFRVDLNFFPMSSSSVTTDRLQASENLSTSLEGASVPIFSVLLTIVS